MKGLRALIITTCFAAVAFAQDSSSSDSSNSDKPGTRFLGSGLVGGLLGGLNNGLGGGVAPGFGGGAPGFGASQTCRYWCRTPQGQAYCCEDNNQPQGPVGVKPGFCPPVRPVCPPVRSFAPPLTCSNDYVCAGVDKCCFDTCLQEHVCKPPVGSGGFGGGFSPLGGYGR
ncbi:hypothetical protein SK128_016989 [Halocaridina rubra]|uniref:WAP domain-containing protein n=1 Tax=Halocaridina rubra TaxID=373956 RepID=A0AAN9AHN6_HALRR